jgi:hypothetical protein
VKRTLTSEENNQMNWIVKTPVVVLLVAAMVALPPVLSHAQGVQSPIVPPQSNAFGKSFEEWNVLQTEYALATELGDADVSDTVGRVRLLPGNFSSATPVFNIKLAPGTPFVAAPFFVFGERYDDPAIPDDDPVALAPVLEEIFANAEIRIELDGRVVLDGSGTELKQFMWGPVYLDEPIVYADPIPRGDANAVAALWVMGIGAVYHPLPVGQHTLIQTVHSDFFGDFVFTYHITVSPK